MADLSTPEIDALFARVFDLMDGAARTDFLTFIGGRIGAAAEGYAREYPDRREGVPLPAVYTLNGKPSKFKSRKQQAFVAMLSKKGKIPGRRTGRLGNSMTHRVTVVGDGVVVQVGTNVDGAEYVIGDEGVQNKFLASLGWRPLGEKIDERVDDLRRIVVTSGEPWLVGYLRGGR